MWQRPCKILGAPRHALALTCRLTNWFRLECSGRACKRCEQDACLFGVHGQFHLLELQLCRAATEPPAASGSQPAGPGPASCSTLSFEDRWLAKRMSATAEPVKCTVDAIASTKQPPVKAGKEVSLQSSTTAQYRADGITFDASLGLMVAQLASGDHNLPWLSWIVLSCLILSTPSGMHMPCR